jgi:hypothetical protein
MVLASASLRKRKPYRLGFATARQERNLLNNSLMNIFVAPMNSEFTREVFAAEIEISIARKPVTLS